MAEGASRHSRPHAQAWGDRLGARSGRQFVGPLPRGGSETGRNPTDRGRPGTKHHIVTDAHGTPLAVAVTAANVSDSTTLERMMDEVPALRSGSPGRPRRRFHKFHADKGYDSRANRHAVKARGMVPRIARRGVESSERLGRHRWVVERTIAWEHQFRRLLVRHDHQATVHLGFLELASAIISFKQALRAGVTF
jgi:transposase